MEVEDRPEFFGKRIDHEWKEGWFKGTVTAIFDENEFDTDCEFEVEYDGYEEHILVELIKDWKEGKVKILSNEEKRADVTVGRKRRSRGTEKSSRKQRRRDNEMTIEKEKKN